MCAPRALGWSRRAAATVARVLGGAAVLVVAGAGPAAAHSVSGGTMPAPPWLLSYVGAFAVLATAFALRATWARSRLALSGRAAVAPEASPADPRSPLQVAGLVAFVLVVVAALTGPNTNASNVAPVAVLVVWWVGLPLACLLLGDVMAAVNPFLPVVRLLERVVPGRQAGAGDDHGGARGRATPPPWTGALFLAGFAWFFVAYYRPGSPRALAVLLIVYAVAAVAGGLVWGRGWLATGEGFGALSAAVALVSVRGRRPTPPPGLAPLMVVWIGSTAFDGIASTELWLDVAGSSRGWGRTLVSTVGLGWTTAVAAGVYLGAVRLSERRTGSVAAIGGGGDAEAVAPLPRAALAGGVDAPEPMPHPLPGPTDGVVEPTGPSRADLLGIALVPLALAWFVGHDLTLLLFEGQNFVALLSDPVGRGWDLLGTIGNTPDYGIVQAGWVPWVQVVALVAGHLASVVVAHDVALAATTRRRAIGATWAMAGTAAVSAVVAPLLVLG